MLPSNSFLEKQNLEATFAVRSSGTLEDGAAKSFAGQYDTFLNITRQHHDIFAAVKKCWASQYNDHVTSYLSRARYESDIEPPKMAVVIQEQVCQLYSRSMHTLQ